MSKVLNHNVDYLKIQTDNGSVLFLHKKDMEVYSENSTVFLKSPELVYTFESKNISDPDKNTVTEKVLVIQEYLDQYINKINTPEDVPVETFDPTYSEIHLYRIDSSLSNLVELQEETNKLLKKIYNPE